MTVAKAVDASMLAAVSVATIYGAALSSANALVFGGLVVAVYACAVFAPGLGGRMGAAILLPLMALFTVVFAAHTGDLLVSVVLAGGAARAGMLVLADARRASWPLNAS